MTRTKKAVIVTGGGAGMGEATALRLARDGCAVGVLDVDGAAAASVARAIAAAGGQAIAVTADISSRAQVEAGVAKIRAAIGPVTVLVNNAGIDRFAPFDEIDDDGWDRVINVNLKGAYIVTQIVLPDIVAAGWGRIINFSSFEAQIGAAAPAFCAQVIEEMLRHSTIATFYRTVVQDFTYDGVNFTKGALVVFATPLAGRDPAGFPEPMKFDPERVQANRHVAFGRGAHICLGISVRVAVSVPAPKLYCSRAIRISLR